MGHDTTGTSEYFDIAVLAERVDRISARRNMGPFNVNYTVKGADPKSIVGALAGRIAFVCPERSGCVVGFDEESDGSSSFSKEERNAKSN